MTEDATAGVRLVLDGALTIHTVDTAAATLRAAVATPPGASPANLIIDCSAASEIDLTFIQLLIATRSSARLRGGTVVLAEAPDGALLNTLTRGGFRVVQESAGGETWFEGAGA